MRGEGGGQDAGTATAGEMDFGRVLQTLGIHVVGVRGLPYPLMLQRVEKIAYFGQVRNGL